MNFLVVMVAMFVLIPIVGEIAFRTAQADEAAHRDARRKDTPHA